MDAARNPFRPGAGTKPKVLAGRDDDLAEALTLAQRVVLGNPQRSLMFYGLRGVGKTVLLNEIEECFTAEGFIIDHIEVSQDDDFRSVISSSLRKLLLRASAVEKAKQLATRALRVLKSFVVTIPDGPDIRLDLEPLIGTADSGDLQSDLVELFTEVGNAGKGGSLSLAIFLDEAQYLDESDFAALIASCHRISQLALPLVVICAGLPQIAGLAGDAKSYAERLFDFRPVGTLEKNEASRALSEPASEEGMTLSKDVLDVGLKATDGYPYFIQEYGKQLWDIAETDSPTLEEARRAESAMQQTLDGSFFKVRLDRATRAETRFMIALGSLGPGPQSIADVAAIQDKKVNSLGPVRAKLVHKGFVYSPDHGKICFTVPHFDRFLARQFPDGMDST